MENFLVPLISWLFVVGIIGWIGFLIYRSIKHKLPSRYHTKYKLFKKPYPEEIVKYLMKNNEMDEQSMINDLIFDKKLLPEKVKEYFWIREQMKKELLDVKGGIDE